MKMPDSLTTSLAEMAETITKKRLMDIAKIAMEEKDELVEELMADLLLIATTVERLRNTKLRLLFGMTVSFISVNPRVVEEMLEKLNEIAVGLVKKVNRGESDPQ
jgi:hypothetical protein